MIENALLIFFLSAASIYFLFLLLVLKGLLIIKRTPPAFSAGTPSLSVIIPCRNEANNISANLKGILEQQYPPDKFEVIYIDDASTDATAAIIEKELSNKQIRLIRIKNADGKGSGKKHALAAGIAQAKGEIIITSDADCIYKPLWLKTIAENFTDNIGFMSGPVVFSSDKTYFGLMQATEFAGLVMTGAGLIGLGKPTICNGANVAYRKSLFDLTGGFKDKHGLSSGDDELVMKKINELETHEVKFLMNTNAVVSTKPAASLREFMHQRARWASKGLYYEKPFVLIALLPFFLFFIMLMLFPFVGIFAYSHLFLYYAPVILIKAFLEFLIVFQGKSILNNPFRLDVFILCQALHPLYLVAATLMGTLGKFEWKERNLGK